MAVAIKDNRKIIGELFHLTQSETGISASSDTTVENYALRYAFAPIWKWQVPTTHELVLEPKHRFAAYIEDDETSALEWLDVQEVRVEVWDADLKRMWIVYEGRYMQSKEETDREKMMHVDIYDPLHLKAGDWVYVLGKAATVTAGTGYTIDVSDSRFTLELTRIRHAQE